MIMKAPTVGEMFTRRMVPNEMWELIQVFIPPVPEEHNPTHRIPDKHALVAIVYIVTADLSWHQLPLHYNVAGSTAQHRFVEWTRAGVWKLLASASDDRWIQEFCRVARERAARERAAREQHDKEAGIM